MINDPTQDLLDFLSELEDSLSRTLCKFNTLCIEIDSHKQFLIESYNIKM